MQKRNIAIVGLGYVGLPIAIAFGKQVKCIGFDINQERIQELKSGFDRTREISADSFKDNQVHFSSSLEDLKQSDFFIVCVPTPITKAKQPDLSPLVSVSQTIGKVLKRGDIVVYESTVYPGVTEDVCQPILEKVSGLKGGVDFKLGYSPERINPGDKEHTVESITKIVSAQDVDALDTVAAVYQTIIKAGVYRASSIKVAEAAKVIENTQRDLNIALINELAMIFDRMDIPTSEVLEAAGTKWNFLKFQPGLVGGHCIGVDPYYLTHKAEEIGYHPQVILAGRRINDGMASYVAHRIIKSMIHAGVAISGGTITVLGVTFKENCPDIRNSKVFDVIQELQKFGLNVQISDQEADTHEVHEEYGLTLIPFDQIKPSSALLVAVAHHNYSRLNLSDLAKLVHEKGVVVDLKSCLKNRQEIAAKYTYWRL